MKQILMFDTPLGNSGKGLVPQIGSICSKYPSNKVWLSSSKVGSYYKLLSLVGLEFLIEVEEAYDHLSKNFNASDSVLLVGFGNGAFSARILTAVLNSQGLNLRLSGKEALKRYLSDCPMLVGSYVPPISVLLVADTTRTATIPFSFEVISWMFGSKKLEIQKVLENVESAYQVLAEDEEDPELVPLLWRDIPEGSKVEQTWFKGSHMDIGGKSKNHDYFNKVLIWALEKLHNHGVEIDLDFLDNLAVEVKMSTPYFMSTPEAYKKSLIRVLLTGRKLKRLQI